MAVDSIKKWTKQLIFSDEYLKAMNENFHIDHFLCRHCDCNLVGQRYVMREEKQYCVSCYEQNFAHQCENCQKLIGIESRDLSFKEKHWHEKCFQCQLCSAPLLDKAFGFEANKVYCLDCYNTSFATCCDHCKRPFRSGSKKMQYRGKQWHDNCFCCCVCQTSIGSSSFIPKNDEIYCIKCYEDKYATRCTKCRQVIVSGGITFREQPWHRDCFNCCRCEKSLAGQRFTTRDVNKQSQQQDNNNNDNDNKPTTTGGDESIAITNRQDNSDNSTRDGDSLLREGERRQQHNAYCIDCYGQLFAKKCHSCSMAIIGLGGTRFVSFEDRSWHNDCFVCTDCKSSLVGKGFITDGPESILCGECARAKLALR